MTGTPDQQSSDVQLLSVVIPARNEEKCVGATVELLHSALSQNNIFHEIIVVDDGSTDQTWMALEALRQQMPQLKPIQNQGLHGFGRAVTRGLDHMRGDAVVIMMADGSDDCRDVVRYWKELNHGVECVFGSRFVKGGGTEGYPLFKLALNRLANTFIRLLFGIRCNDTTNAFKAYRREVIDGCRPLISPHFNLTVELPLKAIVRGYRWKVIPVTWQNRKTGESKLKIKEMGSRYLFICLYVWLEKMLTREDYRKTTLQRERSARALHRRDS